MHLILSLIKASLIVLDHVSELLCVDVLSVSLTRLAHDLLDSLKIAGSLAHEVQTTVVQL